MPQQNQAAAQVEHPKKVFSASLVADHQSAKVLELRKQPFNFPASAISSHATLVLSRVSSVYAVGSNKFNSVLAKLDIQFV
jgi:hypothetical protein